jgi:hypothetical protein
MEDRPARALESEPNAFDGNVEQFARTASLLFAKFNHAP